MVVIMLSFVRDEIRHAFRIQFRIHAEKLSAKAAAPFFEHAVMPVGGFGPFAVAAAVWVYPVVFGLFGVYPDILRVSGIKFGERLQLVNGLVEKPDCVFVVPEIAMRYLERIFVIERYRYYLEENVLLGKIVVFRCAVEVRQRHLIARLHKAVFYFRYFGRFLYVRIAALAVTMRLSGRPRRKRQWI